MLDGVVVVSFFSLERHFMVERRATVGDTLIASSRVILTIPVMLILTSKHGHMHLAHGSAIM